MITRIPAACSWSVRERVLVSGARVDHERLVGRTRELDLGEEGAHLILAWSAVAVVVQSGLTDRHALRVRGELSELGASGVVERGRFVRVHSDRRVHLLEALGGGERRAIACAVDPDGEDPGHARRDRGVDQLLLGLRTEV